MATFDEIHALMKRKRYARALTLLLKKKNKINEMYTSDKSDENHSWYIVGDIFYKQEKYQEALKAFRRSIVSWRDDGEALWAIGSCYMKLGRPTLAERHFRKALAHIKKAHQTKLLYDLGNALFDQGRYAEAIKYYEKISRKETGLHKLAQKNKESARKRDVKNRSKGRLKN